MNTAYLLLLYSQRSFKCMQFILRFCSNIKTILIYLEVFCLVDKIERQNREKRQREEKSGNCTKGLLLKKQVRVTYSNVMNAGCVCMYAKHNVDKEKMVMS